jgi:hypothetical protein
MLTVVQRAKKFALVISQFLDFAPRIVYKTDRKVSEHQAVDTARKA